MTIDVRARQKLFISQTENFGLKDSMRLFKEFLEHEDLVDDFINFSFRRSKLNDESHQGTKPEQTTEERQETGETAS